jgi:hypothetical protein
LPSISPSQQPSQFPLQQPSRVAAAKSPELSRLPSRSPTPCRICAIEQGIVPHSSDVTQDNTPQRDALIWLTDDDPLQLPVTRDIYVLITRHFLALLYESTAGSAWSDHNWRTKGDPNFTCDFTGVTCESSIIPKLILRQSNGAGVSEQTQQC